MLNLYNGLNSDINALQITCVIWGECTKVMWLLCLRIWMNRIGGGGTQWTEAEYDSDTILNFIVQQRHPKGPLKTGS